MLGREQCYKCYWWGNEHERIKFVPIFKGIGTPGLCRKHKPGAERIELGYYLGVQVIMDACDGCGEFREKIKE